MTAADTMRHAFQVWWYGHIHTRTPHLSWATVPVTKNPCDLFAYQELIMARRPAVIIEVGAWYGGATLFFAQLLDMLGGERCVVSIDADPQWAAIVLTHPKVVPITGDSLSRPVLDRVAALVNGQACFVILDSDHHADHVLLELRAYGALCRSGDYMIVEDTEISGHPVPIGPDGKCLIEPFPPGPYEAVEQFLAETDCFSRDRERSERMGLTCAPDGWLRRR